MANHQRFIECRTKGCEAEGCRYVTATGNLEQDGPPDCLHCGKPMSVVKETPDEPLKTA